MRFAFSQAGEAQHGIDEIRAGGEAAAALAHVGEAPDRVDQIVVGRKLERVDAGVAESGAQLGFAALRRGGEALAEAAVVGIDEDLLAGLGVLHHEHAEIGEARFQRVVQPYRDDLVALRELPDLGMLVVQDAETGEQVFVDTHDKAFRKRFAAGAQKREAGLRAAFRDAGVDALELSTDDDLVDAIRRFADMRKRRSRLAAGGSMPKHLEVTQ